MMGNVWEWVQDWYGDYPVGSVTDPVGPSTGTRRVERGGSWGNTVRGARTAARHKNDPITRSNILGFRIVRVVR